MTASTLVVYNVQMIFFLYDVICNAVCSLEKDVTKLLLNFERTRQSERQTCRWHTFHRQACTGAFCQASAQLPPHRLSWPAAECCTAAVNHLKSQFGQKLIVMEISEMYNFSYRPHSDIMGTYSRSLFRRAPNFV